MRVFRANEKATGRTWLYATRRTFGRREFRAALHDQWSPTLKAAKEAAKVAGRFRYDDEPALVTVEA